MPEEEKENLGDFREIPEVTITGEERPPLREISIISTRDAARDVEKMKRGLDKRLAMERERKEKAELAAREKPPKPEIPEGSISAEEAKTLFGGDLAELEIDEATKTFRPRTAFAAERIGRRRRIGREYEGAIGTLSNLRRTEVSAPLMEGISRLFEERRRMLEDLS